MTNRKAKRPQVQVLLEALEKFQPGVIAEGVFLGVVRLRCLECKSPAQVFVVEPPGFYCWPHGEPLVRGRHTQGPMP